VGRSDAGMLTAAGAVALVDGVWMASRPLQQGYAVLQVPGVEGVRGYLNNQEIGRTDSRGYLMMPNLQPYYANRLSIGDADVPIDYEIGKTEQLIATAARGGALVKFDVHKVQTVTGIVQVETTIPAYGEVTSGARKSPVAANGQFWLEDLLPGSHQAQVEFHDGICRFSLVVPVSKAAMVDVGTIICTGMQTVASAQ
jgi:outer membrane usher protein